MPRPSLVDELVHLAQDENTSLLELLRRTRVIAAKLKIPELEAWVKKETAGYTGPRAEIPNYRRIPCELKAINVARGWIPVILGDQGEVAEHFATFFMAQSVAEIDALLKSGNGTAMSSVDPEEHAMLATLLPQLGRTQVARVFGKASLNGVLEAIRDRVLEAALELDAKGVSGEGLSFTAEEMAKAAAVTTSIVNNIYGHNANIASAAHSPNSGMAFASNSATLNQYIGNIQQDNQELANAFKSKRSGLRPNSR
jgi:hypothetical protein